MNATTYSQQLNRLDLVDKTVQSSTADGGQRAYLMDIYRRRGQITARANNVKGAASRTSSSTVSVECPFLYADWNWLKLAEINKAKNCLYEKQH